MTYSKKYKVSLFIKLTFAISVFFIFDGFSQINKKLTKKQQNITSKKIRGNNVTIKQVKRNKPSQLKFNHYISRIRGRNKKLYIKPERYIRKAYPKRYTNTLKVCATYALSKKASPAKINRFRPISVKRKYTLLASRNKHASYFHYNRMKYKRTYKQSKRYKKWVKIKQVVPRKINMPSYLKESRAKPKFDSKEANIWYE